MKLKKLATAAVTAAMALSMCSAAFAEETTQETLVNGDYTGTIHFHNASNPADYSMCDSIFVHTADIKLTDDEAELTFYVAYPIPAFSDQGTDGTIKDVKMTVGGTEYTGAIDIETKAVKTFDTTQSLFGINEGDQLTTEAVTVDLPRSAVEAFDDGIETSAYVNVFMNANQDFVVKVTDLAASETPSEPADETKSMDITASVEEAITEPSYSVTVPASTALGKLSAEKDNSQKYGVTVKASDLNGTLTVSAPESGKLTSGKNELAFTNSFGTQTVSADTEGTTLDGTLGVSAAAVKAAAAGNYTGTTTFTISYAAK